MSINVTINEIDSEEWNDLLERSPHGTPYHRSESLELMAEYSRSTLHRLVGYKGQEPTGLFPVFERSFGPVTAMFSPPPDLKITYLGPILLNFEKLKRRKADRRHRRFIDACLEIVNDTFDPNYNYVRTGYQYDDPRPLLWSGFKATPRYTYVVDLDRDEDEIFMQFGSDVRKNVRDAEAVDHRIFEGGPDDIQWIIENVKARHAEQGVSYNLSPQFAIDLYEELPEGVVRPYVCSVDGERISGHLVTEMDSTLYSWQSVGIPDHELAGNDLVHWNIIRSGIDQGKRWYDLVGANDERLCCYKSKFSPDLREYHSLERGTWSMIALAELYKRMR